MQRLRFYLAQISITEVIIGFNILLFICFIVLSTQLSDGYSLLLLGAQAPEFVVNGEVWRLVTYAFLHANALHLLLNLYFLWQLGLFVEKFYGARKLVIAYVFTAISAGVLSLISSSISYSLGGDMGLSVGASGAIFGLLGLILGTSLQARRYGLELPIDISQLAMIIAVNLFLGFILPNIDNAAHIGGLIGGLFLSLVLEQSLAFSLSGWKNWFVKIAYPLSVLVVFLSFLAQALRIFLAAL